MVYPLAACRLSSAAHTMIWKRLVMDPLVNFALRLPASARSRFARLKWRMLGASLGDHVNVRGAIIPRNPWDIALDDGATLEDGVVLLTTGDRTSAPRIRIGTSAYINRHTIIDASMSITIGKHCMIGPLCYITDHDHGQDRTNLFKDQPLVGAPVVIGEGVWIGAGVTILKGVTLGERCVIGAGSVVTRSVPKCATVVGVPARPR